MFSILFVLLTPSCTAYAATIMCTETIAREPTPVIIRTKDDIGPFVACIENGLRRISAPTWGPRTYFPNGTHR